MTSGYLRREPAGENCILDPESLDFRALVQGLIQWLPEGVFIAEAPQGRLVAISDFGRRLAGRDCSDLLGGTAETRPGQWYVRRADETGPLAAEDLPLTRAARHGEVVVDEQLVVLTPQGREVRVLCSAAPIYDEDGELRWAMATWHDVTASWQAAEALRMSEARLRRAQDIGGIGDWEWDIAADTAVWSASLRRLLKLDPAFEPSGRSFFEFIHPEDRPLAEAAVTALLERDEPIDIELRMVLRDGSQRWLAARGTLERDAEGKPRRIVGVNFDITRRRTAEAALQQERQRTLAHKEALLREANHRIKNNLALTASMLGIQARATGNLEARRQLQDAGERIVMLGHLYNHLAHVDGDRVEAADYLAELGRCLQETLDRKESEFEVAVAADACALSAERATDLGLICNELVTNASKHGRGPDGSCRVSLAFEVLGDEAALRVSDSGPGVPEGFDPEGTTSLGLRLVRRLVGHLGGSLTVRAGSPGSCFEVRFPLARGTD